MSYLDTIVLDNIVSLLAIFVVLFSVMISVGKWLVFVSK